MKSELEETLKEELVLGLQHLEYSYNKVKNLPNDPMILDVEQLETWESFIARFARVSDIFLSKYIRVRVHQEDPAFRGSFRDFLDMSEKIRLIENVGEWMNIRELRNKTAHEYTRSDLKIVFDQVFNKTPFILKEIKKILK